MSNLQKEFMANAVKANPTILNLSKKDILKAIEPDSTFLKSDGSPRILSSDDLKSHNLDLVRGVMQLTGLYVYPTFELIDKLSEFIPDKSKTIEIGSGNGVIAQSLGVKATDSYMQSTKFKPKNAKEKLMQQEALKHIETLGAAPKYGSNVIQCEAIEAVKRFKPETVLGCYITHKWKAGMEQGNALGVEEEKILKSKSVQQYIMCGNLKTHSHKPILALPHEEIEFDGLVCRAEFPELNRIFIWR